MMPQTKSCHHIARDSHSSSLAAACSVLAKADTQENLGTVIGIDLGTTVSFILLASENGKADKLQVTSFSAPIAQRTFPKAGVYRQADVIQLLLKFVDSVKTQVCFRKYSRKELSRCCAASISLLMRSKMLRCEFAV